MAICGSCGGTGKVSCSACGGTGRTSRVTSLGGGGVEINTCAVCSGTGYIRCNFCDGQGQIYSGGKFVHAQTPEEMYHKGTALWSGSRYTDAYLAVEYFTQSIRLDPNNANTYHARGLAQYQLGRFTEAIADFGHAISLYPDNADYYCDRGSAYYSIEQLGKARNDWEKACDMGNTRGCDHLERYL